MTDQRFTRDTDDYYYCGGRGQQEQQQNRVGSERNNSDHPYFESRYDQQRSTWSMDEYDIRSFIEDAIQSDRAVIFLKDHESDALCRFVKELFSTECSSEDIAFYNLDEIPHLGERVQEFLVEHCESTVSENCFVFVRGTHVPLPQVWKIFLATMGGKKSTEPE